MTDIANTMQPETTLDAPPPVDHQPAFAFSVRNRWIDGPRSQSLVQQLRANGQEQQRIEPFFVDTDQPPILGGRDEAPNPVEYLLHALASCLTASLVRVATAHGVPVNEVESSVEGDVAAQDGGLVAIRALLRMQADASCEELDALLEETRRHSVVLNALTRGVPVHVALREPAVE